jgi:tetrahydromethanopterin S-methyltransferase subunit E
LRGIERAGVEGKNPDVKVQLMPGLNHLFQTAVTGSPMEYATIEETMSPSALRLMTEWIIARTR